MATSTSDRWTYERYAALPEDGQRHEIIDGRHYVTPAPTLRHQELLLRVYKAIDRTAPEGARVLVAPCDVLLGECQVVQPDVLMVRRENLGVLTEANIQGVPDLVVEVSSPSTGARDRGIKRSVYERFGVTEYWLVDPVSETVTLHRLESAGFVATTFHRGRGGVVISSLLPSLALDLCTLFAPS